MDLLLDVVCPSANPRGCLTVLPVRNVRRQLSILEKSPSGFILAETRDSPPAQVVSICKPGQQSVSRTSLGRMKSSAQVGPQTRRPSPPRPPPCSHPPGSRRKCSLPIDSTCAVAVSMHTRHITVTGCSPWLTLTPPQHPRPLPLARVLGPRHPPARPPLLPRPLPRLRLPAPPAAAAAT